MEHLRAIVCITIATALLCGCSRSYDSSTADGEEGEAEVNAKVDVGVPFPPYIGSLGEGTALHVPYQSRLEAVDLGASKHLVWSFPYSYVWDSDENRIDARIRTVEPADFEILWNPNNGTGVLVQVGDSAFWMGPRVSNREFVGFNPQQSEFYDFGDVLLVKSNARAGLALFEFRSRGGVLERTDIFLADSPIEREVKRYGALYTYRDAEQRLWVRSPGQSEPVAEIGAAWREFSFGADAYLYLETDQRYLFDTRDGSQIEFPQGWFLGQVTNPESDWVFLQRSTDVGFWRPGAAEVAEVSKPSGFGGFDAVYVDEHFGFAYATTTGGAVIMKLYAFEGGEWYEIEGIENFLGRQRPTTNRLDDGTPVVVFPSRLLDSDHSVHYWTLESGIQPLPGAPRAWGHFRPTADPLRFFLLEEQQPLILADISKGRTIQIGVPLNCANRGLSHDGRRALTFVDKTVSIFDADTLNSQVIARSPLFFGKGCVESWNRALNRGLFLNAFDGEIGDLTYWDGEATVKVLEGIPPAGAKLDPITGSWTIAAPVNKSVFLGVFDSESEVLDRVGRASAKNLEQAYDVRERVFAYLDTTDEEQPRSTIYRRRLISEPDAVPLASGGFTAIKIIGDDLVLRNDETGVESMVFFTLDGQIDAGPLTDQLWDPEDFEEEPQRPPGFR